jgi:hemerythrin family non-heme iron protein
MGFDIPEPYVWDESFQVFYADIDDEHKGLFKGIFDLAAAPGDEGKLGHLLGAVISHFKTEEAKFEAKNYFDKVAHKTAHDDFVAKLKALKTPVSADVITFAKDWLVNHIKGTDFKYKGKL